MRLRTDRIKMRLLINRIQVRLLINRIQLRLLMQILSTESTVKNINIRNQFVKLHKFTGIIDVETLEKDLIGIRAEIYSLLAS